MECAHWPVSRHGAAARAGRRGAERVAEQQALIGEPLDVRRRHRMAVGLHVAAGVVRVDIDDVGFRVYCPGYSDGEGYEVIPGLCDAAQRQHAAVRAARGYRRRRPAAGVLRAPVATPGSHASRESTSTGSRTPSCSSCSRRPTRARPTRGDPIPRALERGHDAERRVRGEADVDAPARPRGAARPPGRRGARSATACPEPRYVHVTRGDKVAQAVSLWRAVQTRAWRAGDGEGGGRRRLPRRRDRPSRAPARRAGRRVARVVRRPTASSRSRSPTRRSPPTPTAATAAVLEHLGVGPAEIPEPPLRRQGDDRSARWVERYRVQRV